MASSSTSAALPSSSATAGESMLAITPDGRIVWRRMLAFLCMILGMFMAILDIQIVSASISEVQAGLSASASEVTWVQTSYLIAEVIMIPLSGFLSRALGTRILFTGAAAGFTFASLMCGLSTTLNEMIFWRAVQGFVGGGMIPTVFATSYLLFPRSKQAYVNPVMGLIITLAPTIGPSVGGVVTDALSWHWLFFVNVIPGIGIAVAAYTLIDFDKPDWALLKRFDWFGLAALTAFLGPLEYVLEEGARDNWFDDETIVVCTAVAAVSGALFFWRALTAPEPIVDIRAFRIPNFGFGCLLSFVVGIGLFGLTYLYPLYLSQVRGYSALMIGEALFVTGLTMFISAPIVGKLMTKLDPRVLIASGFVAFAAGTWLMSGLTRDWDFWELIVPQVLRGFGLMAAMAPINFLALGALPPARLKNAASLYNLTRTLGGAVGLAILTTLMNARTDLHLARLHERVSAGHRPAVEFLDLLTQKFAAFGHDAPAMALKTLNDIVRRQGVVLAFGDIFLLMTVMFGLLLPATLLLRRPPPIGSAPAAEAH
jgi:MFS transporter, DHA2 family, multidrug resistance protein